jgi:hypothetical protein
MKSILAEAKCWFLERLDYEGARLLIEVTEGIVASVPQDVSIDDVGTIGGARSIEVTNQSRRVRVQFSNVLAYQVTDESYDNADPGQVDGQILCKHTGSAYLQYVLQNTLIEDLVDDPAQHYSLNLADDIIEVITTTEPSIDLIL